MKAMCIVYTILCFLTIWVSASLDFMANIIKAWLYRIIDTSWRKSLSSKNRHKLILSYSKTVGCGMITMIIIARTLFKEQTVSFRRWTLVKSVLILSNALLLNPPGYGRYTLSCVEGVKKTKCATGEYDKFSTLKGFSWPSNKCLIVIGKLGWNDSW